MKLRAIVGQTARVFPSFVLLAMALLATSAGAVADGDPLASVVTEHVFGSSAAVGNTLMEHDGTTNFALRVGGSDATISLSQMAPDATVVRAFLFWGGTFDTRQGIPLDRTVDFRLPNGTFFNNLAVDTPVAGEPTSTLNRCVSRNHVIAGQTQPMFVCRREVTFLLQQLGPGGAVGTYNVDDVRLKPGDCNAEPALCQAAFGGWSLVVMWESPTEPVKRDLVLFDGFFALDEQGTQFGGFSSGIGPQFQMNGFTIGPTADGEITFMAFEGDAELGVPPQNFGGVNRCNDGKCEDFIQIRTGTNATFTKLQDAVNRPGNLMNGSNNVAGGVHPGLDIDTFDIGPSGLNVLRPNDTLLFLQPGSGDGVPDDGSGGSGELFLLGYTLLSVETFSPRFTNAGTEKVVLEPVAGAGETLNYILRVQNDGSARATNTRLRDQLPAGVTYVPNSTTNTCGTSSADVGGTSPVLQGTGLNIGTLNINARCEVRFRVTINSDVADGTVLDNFFTVSADGVDPLLIGPATTVVEAAQLGQPTKTVTVVGGDPSAGSTLSYTIRVPNAGQRTAPGVRIVDVLPAQLQNLQVLSIPSGAVNNSSGTTLDIANISVPANGFVDVTFTAQIRPGTTAGTSISNQGTVTQPSLDAPLLTDDPRTAPTPDPTVTVVSAGVSLVASTKSVRDVNGGRVEPGDVLEFTVRVDKTGSSPTVISLTDNLPANTGGCTVVSSPPGGFASCAPGGTNGTGVVTGAFAVAGPTQGDFVFRVTLAANAPDGFVVTNTARLVPLADPAFAVDVSSPPLTVFARPEFITSTKAVVDVNGGQARPGDVLTWTVTVRNSGSIPATNVVVTDAVPASLVSVTPADGGVLANGTVTWTIPTLAVNASSVVRFNATIAAGTLDGATIANTATITADPPAQPFTTPPASVVVRASPTLVLTKTVADLSPPPFRPGDTVRYTVVVRNTGDGQATSVVVRDTLDPSFEAAILNNGGRAEGGDVVFDSATTPALSTVAPGAQVTLTFDARLLGVLPNNTVVANQARGSATQVTTPVVSDDPNTATANDPTVFAITSQAVLAMDKTFVDDNGGALLPGETVTFTLSVRNTGDAPAANVSVTDALDTRLAFVSSSTGGTAAGNTVSFSSFTLVPGAPRNLLFVARVAAPLANGTTIDNQAAASSATATSIVSDDPGTAAPLDPTRLVITSRPVFDTTTKTVADVDGDGRFEPGDAVRYTLVVTNTGSEDGQSVVVTDAIPAELTNVVAGQGGVVAGNTVTWSLGTVAVNAPRTLTVDATLRRPLADAVVVANQATVRATGIPDTLSDDPATAAVDDPTRFTVFSKPHLVVKKTVVDGNGAPAEPGDAVGYTITVQNDGGRDAGALTVTDVVDPSLTNVVAQDGGTLAGNTITWTLAGLALDATTTLRFSATIRSPLANGTVITNQARVDVAEAGVPGAPFRSDDPTTATPDDPTLLQVVSAANLTVTTLESFDAAGASPITTARPGDVVRYTTVVRNSGNATANDVVVTLPLPAEVTLVAAPGGRASGGVVTFDKTGVAALAAVAPGDIVPLVVDVRVSSPLDNGTAVTTQARIAATGVVTPFSSDDPSTAALGDPTVFTIVSSPDLASLEKTFTDEDGAPVEPGDELLYHLTLENRGDAVARTTTLTDAIPAALEIVDASGGVVAGNTVTYALGDLAPGVPVERVVRVRVKPDVTNGTVVANQAGVVANGTAPVLSDDPGTVAVDDATTFTVLTVPRLVVEKDVAGPRVVAPGDVVTWTIAVRSVGTAPVDASTLVDGVAGTLTDVVPGPGLSFDAATSRITASLAPIAPGATSSFTYTTRVVDGLVNGTQIVNQATVTAPVVGDVLSDDPTTAAPLDATAILVDARPDLATSAKVATDENGGDLLPGDVVRWVLTVSNTGTGTASDVRITDVLDDHFTIEAVEDGGTSAGRTVVWDQTTTPALAAVARNASVTVAVRARVNDDVVDGTSIANQATLVSRDLDAPAVTDDPATAEPGDPTIVVVKAPRIVLEKRIVDDNGGALEPGDDVEYRIVARNDGSVGASNVVLSDVIPVNGFVDVSALDGGAITGGVATWNIPTLAPGATVTVRLAATVDPLATGGTVIANRAELVADEVGLAVRSDDPDTAAPDDETTRIVSASEGFAGTIELFDGESGAPIVAPVLPRQRVRAKVTFTNTGTQVAQAVVVRVPFERLRYLPDETTAGGLVDAAEVRWDASQNPALAQVDPGEAVSLELEGAIASPIPDDIEIPVLARVSSVSTATPVTIGPAVMRTKSRPDLSATTKEVLDEDGGLVEPGDVLTYRITVLNDGGNVARQVTLVDAIPGGTVYLAGSTRVRGQPVADDGGAAPTLAGLALGDVDPGRAVVVEMKVRVAPGAPRGLRIDNQAILRAADTPDAVSDNPATPLLVGDPTSVIVGGGAALSAQKVAAPSPAKQGEPLHFEIRVENIGTEPSEDLVVEDAVPAGTTYRAGSLRVDGAPVTDAADRDGAEIDGTSIRMSRDLLDAGDGVTLAFDVVVDDVSVVTNQATVTSRDGTLLTDGDPSVPGAQPTLVPVTGARVLVVDEDTLTLADDDGGALEAGDDVTARAVLKNRSLEAIRVTRVDIGVSALLVVDPADVGDPRFTLSADRRTISLAPGTTLEIEAGGALDLVLHAKVSDAARAGDSVRVVGSAAARFLDDTAERDVDLGRAALTVGLLPGTAAVEGTLFLDGRGHDRVLQPETDVRVGGLTVLAFWRDDEEPVQTAIADAQGRYRLFPIPAGRYRLELRSPGGASFGATEEGQLESGEVRDVDIAVEPTGAVYVSGTQRPAVGSRVALFVDDGDLDPANDVKVDERLLGEGQQDQPVTAQGLYRFDAPPGRYRIAVETEDPLTSFPSAAVPVKADATGNPMGALAPADTGDVVDLPLPRTGVELPYFLRFDVRPEQPRLQRNFVPVDGLKSQLLVTKTASRKRASVGDIVSYTVRAENRALGGVPLDAGGVEIVDALPPGFKMIDGSYRLDRIEKDARGQERRTSLRVREDGGRIRTFGPFALLPKSVVELRYNVVVGPGVAPGEHENRAALRLAAGQIPVSDDATAVVQIVPDGLFDLGTVRAKVWCDDDGDGWQDEGEDGLPGARLYVDTGQYVDSDIVGKAHFSAIPAGMHLVKIDERTLPPGTTLSSPRQTFYMSSGMPAQIAFAARCATEAIDTPELVVNEAAYRPEPTKTRKVHVEGRATPARLLVDETEIDVPRADLGLAPEGGDPTFTGAPGPNLTGVEDGALRPRLTFVPRIDAPSTSVITSWQIAIDALGAPAPGAKAGDPLVADPAMTARRVWLLSGRGAPPERIAFDGRDPANGNPVVFAGQLYRATLAVGLDDGTRATAAPRVFGVRAGLEAAPVTTTAVDIDESGGPLFTRAGKPTPRLLAWLGTQAPALQGKKLVAVVHTDPTQNPNAAYTATRAAAVEKALAGFGIPAADVEPRGAGDAEPKVPNLRKKDRLKNRRVELVVEKPADVVAPPLAPPVDTAPRVVVHDQVITDAAPFSVDVNLPEGTTLEVDITSSTGARVHLTGPAAQPVDRSGNGEPVGVEWRPDQGILRVAGVDVSNALLEARVRAVAPAAPPSSGVVWDVTAPGVDVVEWNLRILDDSPATADSDAGHLVRELRGDGALPAQIAWDGLDRDGKPAAATGAHVRARLVVKNGAGDVGISPDFTATLGQASAAPVSTSVSASSLRVDDPFGKAGTLSAAAKKRVQEIAAEALARGAVAVRVEVHTDDVGSRLQRRTRTQRQADELKKILVDAGVKPEIITATGMGSDVPLVPNVSAKMRAQNRRADIAIDTPAPVAAPVVVDDAPASSGPAPSRPLLLANGKPLSLRDGAFQGVAPAMKSGEVVLDMRDASGARASLRVHPGGGEVWQGDPGAFDAWSAGSGVPALVEPPPSSTVAVDVAAADAGVAADGGPEKLAQEDAVDAAPAHPDWWPDEEKLAARNLKVELPVSAAGAGDGGVLTLHSDRVLVRGQTAPGNKLTIGAEAVPVDPLTGRFTWMAKVPEGDSELVVAVTDPKGNIGRVKRPVSVDTTGWFVLGLADTAFGGEGADLGERGAFTSITLGDTFLYGRGAAFVKGKWRGSFLFQDYDLTLHVDTRRWQDDLFAPELIDPERFFPVYGDSSTENTDAMRSGIPLYLDLKADASRATIGNVRTDLVGGDLFRYQRARTGAQIVYDRGWSTPFESTTPVVGPKPPAPSPETDPWRTQVTTFVAGGGGQRHARVELLGTGSSVYFLRHERVVEGSERVSVIVRDAITGAELARTAKIRDVDYNIRYAEGRVFFKEPVGAFAESSAMTNQNLGQVASSNRVFIEVEYEHQDDDPFMGVGAGAQLKQTVAGHAEVGGGYVYESREGGLVGYQLGGGHLRLFVDEGTWIQGELLGSQSVDAGNFISTDGGLTYTPMGQSLDQKDARIGRQPYSADRAGAAFKLDGQAQLGAWLGRKANSDVVVRAYVQNLDPGFFAGASIVEQGQTKWGTEGGWQLTDDDKLKLRYDGVISRIPSFAPLTEFRTLHRQIASARYEHRVIAPVVVSGEYGYGYTADSGSFGDSSFATPREVHTNVTAVGVDWQVMETLALSLKQETILTGDENQLKTWQDHLITHLQARYALTEELSLIGGVDARWSGENQVNAGVSWAVNKTSRVYVTERVGVLPAPVTGTMGFTTTTVVGGESDIAEGSKAYAEYQLDGGFAGDQTRGVVGIKNNWKLPWGFALQVGYERILMVGGFVPTTENGNVPPGAFTDGTFYAAPGANGGGSYLGGDGSRDAVSAGVEYKSGEDVVASQRFELRYDNQSETRGGHDRLWLLSSSGAAWRISPELSLLARYNIALAQDLALAQREAYFEEGAFGVAFRPVTHDWLSVLAKISRRVDVRPLSLELGTSDDYTAHAMSIEPIVELPWKVQLVEKLALKHASERLGDVPEANAVTGLWINRANLHALGLIRSFGVDPILPGEVDLGLEYRVLAGLTYGTVEHGPLVEVQVSPVEYFRVGVGFNWTHFSDDELDRGSIDRSGFFVRAVGSF